MPTALATVEAAVPNNAPIAAPVMGAASAMPARNPSVPLAKMLLVSGNGSRSRVYDPSVVRLRMATSSSRRYCPAPATLVTSARARSAWPASSYPMAQRCASHGVMVVPFILLVAADLGDDHRRFFAS